MIHAPYNFVPLARWVYFPDWSGQASHDAPFSDGIDGSLELTITAQSPLLVAAEQADSNKKFVRSPDGRYFIPGTSLRGLVRNVLEIATFGKLALVDERFLGVRDLSGGLPAYSQAMTNIAGGAFRPNSKAGWLSFKDGHWQITPCEHSRVNYKKWGLWEGMDSLLPAASCQADYRAFVESRLDDAHRTARAKYEKWAALGGSLDLCFDPEPPNKHQHSNDNRGRPKFLHYSKALLGTGATDGRLVLTGQPNRSGNQGSKHMEFVFHSRKSTAMEVDAIVMRGFLQVHEESTDWDWWRQRLRDSGEEIPVFYLESAPGKTASLGLAQMYKLPYRHSTHQARDHSTPLHGSDTPDFAETLFGFANDDENKPGLRGRVSFSHSFCTHDNPPPDQSVTVILGAPKSSYFPNYIRQKTDDSGTRLATDARGYATLMDNGAELRGWKRYPAKPFRQPHSVAPNKVTATLHPLQKDVCFIGKLRFHNLKPQELGSLVWALTWSDKPGLLHSLGMGKPLGYGQVRIELGKASLRFNGAALSLDNCVDLFVAEMDAAHTNADGSAWLDSPQIRSLLAMADPGQASGKNLSHMVLDHTHNINEFTKAKRRENFWVLADYAPYTPPSTPTASGNPGPTPKKGRSPTLALLLAEVMKTNHIQQEEVALHGQALAKAWTALGEEAEKAAVKQEILSIWQNKGWWDAPNGKAAKNAKLIYQGDS